MSRTLAQGSFALAIAPFALLVGCTFQTPDLQPLAREKSLIVPPPMEAGYETPGERGQCGASDYSGLVGTKWSPDPADLPPRARVIRPGDLVTQDYVPARLNIHLDKKGVVVRVACG